MFGFKAKKKPVTVAAPPVIAPVRRALVSRQEMEFEAKHHPLNECDRAELKAIEEAWRTGQVARKLNR